MEAYQAMRVASFLVAVTFAAEIGDVRRFDTPDELMSFLGLVPAESSTGDTGPAEKSAPWRATAARGGRWSRLPGPIAIPARVSETLRARLEGLPKPVRDIAWKAQIRLCARYRCLSVMGKKLPSSWPRLLARWRLSCGPSERSSRQRKPGRRVSSRAFSAHVASYPAAAR